MERQNPSLFVKYNCDYEYGIVTEIAWFLPFLRHVKVALPVHMA